MNVTARQIEQGIQRAIDAGAYDDALKMEQALNQKTQYGAPLQMRSVVGAAKTPEDRLATVQQWYPEAKQIDGNIFYYDEDDNRVAVNKPGLDWGDAVEHLRELALVGGGLVGGALGSATLNPAGTYGGAALGTATAGMIYDKLTPFKDSRSATEQVMGTAIDAAGGLLGGPAAPAMANPRAGYRGIGELAVDVQQQVQRRSLERQAAAEAQDRVRAAADDVGMDLTAGQITGNSGLNRLEGLAESTAFGGPIIQRQREGASDALQNYIQRVTGSASGSPAEAGGHIRSSAESVVKNYRDAERLAWEALEQGFKDAGKTVDSPASTKNLMAIRDRAAQIEDQAGPWSNLIEDRSLKKLVGVIDEALETGKQPSYEVLKRFKSRLGEQIDQPLLTSRNTSGQELARQFGAVADDLDETVRGWGPDLADRRQAAMDATRYVSKMAEGLNPTLKKTDAEVFGVVERAFKKDPTKFAEVVDRLDVPGVDIGRPNKTAVMTELLHRMGRSKPGAQNAAGDQFSPSTFLTNYNKLMQEAPENLKHFDQDQLKAIENISIISDRLKDQLEFVNRSRTGLAMQGATAGTGALLGSLLGGVGGGATVGAGATVVPALVAKVLTSKSLARNFSGLSKGQLEHMPIEEFMRRASAAGLTEEGQAQINSFNDTE